MPADRLIFEFTENEDVDLEHVKEIVAAYRALGFATAIGDFGAGFSGLNRLAMLETDIVKLDMELIRGVDSSGPRRLIVAALLGLCADLGRIMLAEGIETGGEMAVLRDLGVCYMLGYYFARPELSRLPAIHRVATARAA